MLILMGRSACRTESPQTDVLQSTIVVTLADITYDVYIYIYI